MTTRLNKEICCPDAMTPEQWKFYLRYDRVPAALAMKWAARCGYADRADEFEDELRGALMLAAKNYKRNPDGGTRGACAYVHRWLSTYRRRCAARRSQWDRMRHVIDAEPPSGMSDVQWIPERYVVGPETDHIDDRDEVEYVMAGLDERSQRVLRAIFWEGKTRKQVAREMGVHKNTIKAILDRAYAAMADRLNPAA